VGYGGPRAALRQYVPEECVDLSIAVKCERHLADLQYIGTKKEEFEGLAGMRHAQ